MGISLWIPSCAQRAIIDLFVKENVLSAQKCQVVNFRKSLLFLMDCEVASSVDSKILQAISGQIPKEGPNKSDKVKMHCVFEASFRINNKNTGSGIVAVSNHNICFFKKERSKCTKLLTLNMMRIRAIDIEHDEKMRITAKTRYPLLGLDEDINIVLIDDDHMRFWQVIWRNIQLHSPGMADRFLPRLTTDNEQAYPILSLDFSPAQRIQFGYSAFCSLEPTVQYDHRLVQLFHRRFSVSNFLLDLSQIPSSSGLVAFARMAVQSKSFTALLATSPVTIEPWTALNLFLANEVPLKVVCINADNYNMQKIAPLLSKSEVVRWSLSGRNLTNKHELISAFAQTTRDIKELEFGYMGLSTRSAVCLLDGIRNNRHLHSLEALGLSGVMFVKKVRKRYQRMITSLRKDGALALKRVVLRDIGRGTGKIAYALVVCEAPLESIDFSHNKRMSVWSVNQILQLVTRVKTIYDVDISDTNFSSAECAKMAEVLASNGSTTPRKLKLNDMKLGKRIAPVLSAILDANSDAWAGLSFDRNKLDERMAALTTSVLTLLPNLQYLSLSYNFSSEMPGVGQHLAKIMGIKSLRTFILRGKGKRTLRFEAKPVITALGLNDNLYRFDISGNCIGNTLYSQLCDAYEQNTCLRWLSADSNCVTDVNLIIRMMKIALSKDYTWKFTLPTQDITAITKTMNSTQKSQAMSEIVSLNMSLLMAIELNTMGTPLERRMFWELPETMAQEIVKSSYKQDETDVMKRRNLHTCGCAALNLPLPFQSSADDPLSAEKLVHLSKPELHVLDTPSLSELAVEKPLIKLENEYTKPESVTDSSSDDTKNEKEDESEETSDDVARKTYVKRRKLEFAFDTRHEQFRQKEKPKKFEKREIPTQEGRSMEKARVLEILQTMYVPELQRQQLQMSSESDSEDSNSSSESDAGTGRRDSSSSEERNHRRWKRQDSSDEEGEKPKRRARRDSDEDDKPRRKRQSHLSSDDESFTHKGRKHKETSSEDETPKKRRRKREESSSEDETPKKRRKREESSSEDETPRKRRKREESSSEDETSKKRRKREESSSEDLPRKKTRILLSSDDDDVDRRRKQQRTSLKRREDSSDDEGFTSRRTSRRRIIESSSDDEPVKKRQEPNSRKRRQIVVSSSDEEFTSKRNNRRQQKRRQTSESDDDTYRPRRASGRRRSSSEEEVPVRGRRRQDSDDEPTPRMSRRKVESSSSDEERERKKARQRTMKLFDRESDSRGVPKRKGESKMKRGSVFESDSDDYRPKKRGRW